jgi:hypothetical protein
MGPLTIERGGSAAGEIKCILFRAPAGNNKARRIARLRRGARDPGPNWLSDGRTSTSPAAARTGKRRLSAPARFVLCELIRVQDGGTRSQPFPVPT